MLADPSTTADVLDDATGVMAVSLAFAVGGLVHGITGFGAGMTAMAIAPLGLKLMDAVAIVAIYVLVVCVSLAWTMRDALAKPSVRSLLPPLCIGSVLGVPLGVKLLIIADPRMLKILLGASMLAFVVERVLHELKHQPGARGASPTADKAHTSRSSSPVPIGSLAARCKQRGSAISDAEAPDRRLLPASALSSSDVLDCDEAMVTAAPVFLPLSAGALASTPAWSDPKAAQFAIMEQSTIEPSVAVAPEGRGKNCWQRASDRIMGLFIGTASGLLDGALNEGGPPAIIFVTLQDWPKDDAKATLQFLFLVEQLFTVFTLAAQGVLQPRHLVYDLVGLPAAAIGLALGVCICAITRPSTPRPEVVPIDPADLALESRRRRREA